MIIKLTHSEGDFPTKTVYLDSQNIDNEYGVKKQLSQQMKVAMNIDVVFEQEEEGVEGHLKMDAGFLTTHDGMSIVFAESTSSFIVAVAIFNIGVFNSQKIIKAAETGDHSAFIEATQEVSREVTIDCLEKIFHESMSEEDIKTILDKASIKTIH